MPTASIVFNRPNHKAFIEGLAQGTPNAVFSNLPAITAYTKGFLYLVDITSVDSYTVRPRAGNRIESVIVSYTYR